MRAQFRVNIFSDQVIEIDYYNFRKAAKLAFDRGASVREDFIKKMRYFWMRPFDKPYGLLRIGDPVVKDRFTEHILDIFKYEEQHNFYLLKKALL